MVFATNYCNHAKADTTQASDNPTLQRLAPLTVTTSQHLNPYQNTNSHAATGLTLKLQETPQSVSIITNQIIQDKMMDKITDTLAYGTGVQVSAVDSVRSRIAVRGFGDIEQLSISGTPMSSGGISGIANPNLAMYDKVEITRGATGLIAGAGDPSAHINLIRKQATSNHLQGDINLTLGTWGHKKAVADIQMPISSNGKIRSRLVISHLNTKSFQEKASHQQSSLYATLDGDIGNNTEVSIGAGLTKSKNQGVSWLGLPLFYRDGSRTNWTPNKSISANWSNWTNKNLIVFAHINHEFNGGLGWHTSAIYNRSNDTSDMLWTSGTPERHTGQGMMGSYDYWFAPHRHLQLESKLNIPFHAFNHPQEIMVGISHGHQINHWDSDDNDEEWSLGDIHHWQGHIAKPSYHQVFGSHYDTTQNALVAVSRLQLYQPIKLIVGGRLTHYKEKAAANRWGTPAYNQSQKALTPYLGIIYQPDENSSIYASYTNIFKPQTHQDKNGKFLKPLIGNSYEIGLKKQWLGGNLTTNMAIYQTHQDNFAQPDGKIGNTDQDAHKPIKGAKVTGYEAELIGKITPDWDMSASLTHFKTKSPNNEPLVSYAPRQSFKLVSKYDLSALVDGLSLGGGIQWYAQPPKTLENPKTKIKEKVGNPAYAIMDIMANYQFNNQSSVQLNINNVFDKKYYHVNDWYESLSYGEPRHIKIGVNYQF